MFSVFEENVREAVKAIPRGKVASYLWVAQKIGSPRAFRAVGNAVKKNRDSCVPCHRIVRQDGKSGFYNKGAKIKEKLLKEEGIIFKDGRIPKKYYLG